jgi:hypothetical protein
MPEPMDGVLAQIEQANALLKAVPGAEEILRNATSVEGAMRQITELITKTPSDFIPLLQAAESFSESIQRTMAEGPPPVVVGSNGEVRWNPIIEAGILERASIDGDVPEFRTGPLPEGAMPAIPIKTRSLDPVLVGLQLKRTSEMAASTFALAVEEHKALCDKIQEEGERSGLLPALIEQTLPPVPTGIEGYEAGRAPALWEPEPVSPWDVYALDKDEAAEMLWLSFATTQGRRSLAPAIEKILVENAPEHLQIVVKGSKDRPKDTEFAVWSSQAFGPRDLNPSFNPSASALASFTLALLKSGLTGTVAINIEPLSGTADRRFGWVLHYWKINT